MTTSPTSAMMRPDLIYPMTLAHSFVDRGTSNRGERTRLFAYHTPMVQIGVT